MKKASYKLNILLIITFCLLFLLSFVGSGISSFNAETPIKQNNSIFVESNRIAENETANNENSENETVETPTPPQNLGVIVSNDEYGINDGYLYQYLLAAYNDYYKLNGAERLTQIYTNMFQDFTELNLTETNSLIKSLSGIRDLNLENLKVLNVGRNQIKTIAVEDLRNLLSLEELTLYDNKLTELTIPTSLVNLRKLNLNKNYISAIDLSGMNQGEVYLSFNKITTIKNVTMPRVIYNTNLYVELFNNNILDADEIYNSSAVEGGKITVELGLQGYGLNYKANDEESDKITPVVAKSVPLKFYNSEKYPNMEIKIYNKLTNLLVNTITNNSENKISTYNLGVGEYKLDYLNSSTGLSMYDYLNEFGCAFKSHEGFKVVPTSPVIKFVIKGKEYDSRGKFNGTGKMIAKNLDSDGEIYYSIAGGEWIKGTEVTLNRGGMYDVAFKCVVGELGSENAYESAVVSKLVQQSLNPYIPDFVMLILIVVIVLLLFFVALPLIIKYGIKR